MGGASGLFVTGGAPLRRPALNKVPRSCGHLPLLLEVQNRATRCSRTGPAFPGRKLRQRIHRSEVAWRASSVPQATEV